MPFKSRTINEEHSNIIVEMYNNFKSPSDISKELGYTRSQVKSFLGYQKLLRTMSESSKIAVSQGKKDKAISKLIITAKTTNKFNPKKSHSKEKHPMWISDRSLLKDKRHRSELRDWRKKIFERDNYTCQMCGQRGGKLQADHILPYSHFEELRESLSNGRTLCEDCHKTTNTYSGKLRGILREEFLIF